MKLGKEEFTTRESFTPWLLPTKREVVERMLFHLMPSGPSKTERTCTKDEAAFLVAKELSDHWVQCNVYPMTTTNICKAVRKLYDEFRGLSRSSSKRQTEKWWLGKAKPFVEELERGFDIRAKSSTAVKKQEQAHGVKETDEEDWFYFNQIFGDRKMVCEAAVDKKWQKCEERKQAEEESMERKKMENETARAEAVEVSDILMSSDDEDDDEYQPEDEENKTKRRKLVNESDEANRGELPRNWRHVRHSVWKVRPEYYRACDRMVSELHMSRDQAIGSTIIVAKELFNIEWLKFEEDTDKITLDTVPHKKRNIEVGKALEALALAQIVGKIMENDENSTITYHDDGSKKQGAGSFSVQGITISGNYYPFPTMPIASETRKNLADLKMTILNILSVCGNVPADTLWSKVDFVMTDGTGHNLEVEKMVAESLGSEHVPGHLLCQVHPVNLFNREMQKMWKEVDTTIGPDKIFAGFAVSVSDQQVSVTEQWMDCVTRLVTHDYDQKAWNKAEEFDIFIAPLQNPARRLIAERFNSLAYTCLVSNWLDEHVSEFLAKYTSITNSLACIVRSFESLDYVRVLSAIGVILGVQLVEPFLSLTSSSETTWQKLVEAFPTLYHDLSTVEPEMMLDLTRPALSFISSERSVFLETCPSF